MNIQILDKIETQIKAHKNLLDEQIQPYAQSKKIIIFGASSSGKSSIIHYLTHNELEICENIGRSIVLQNLNDENMIKYNEDSNLVFIESPGFENYNNFEDEITSSLMIENILETCHNNEVKILIVLSASEFDSQRGKLVLKICETIFNLFPNIDDIINSIGFIITKGDFELKPCDYIEHFVEKISPDLKKFLDFFIQNETNVFSFPRPSRSKIGEKYEFDDLSKLEQFLQNGYFKLDHKFVLSETVNCEVMNLKSYYYENVEITINEIFTEITKSCSNDTNNFVNIVNDLKTQNVCDLHELKLFFENINNINLYCRKIGKYEYLNTKLCQLLKDDSNKTLISKILPNLIEKQLEPMKINQNHTDDNESLEKHRNSNTKNKKSSIFCIIKKFFRIK